MHEWGDTGWKDRDGGAEGQAPARKDLHFMSISDTLKKMTVEGREENAYE